MLHIAALIQTFSRVNDDDSNSNDIHYEYNPESIYWGYIKDTKRRSQVKNTVRATSTTTSITTSTTGKKFQFEHTKSNDELFLTKPNHDANNGRSLNLFKDNRNFDSLNVFINDFITSGKNGKKFNFDDYKWKLYVQALNNYSLINKSLFDKKEYQEEVLLKPKFDTNDNNDKINLLFLTNLFSYAFSNYNAYMDDLNELKQLYENLTEKYNPIKIYNGNIINKNYNENKNFFNLFKFHVGMYSLNDLLTTGNTTKNLQQIENFILNTNTFWLMSNLFEKQNDQLPITKCNIMMIIDWNKHIKIGFIGLINYSKQQPSTSIKYSDFIDEANHLSKELRARNVNYIIVLTNMAWSDLEYLAQNASDINLILSSDEPTSVHEDYIRCVNDRVIMKNFNLKNLSLITIYFDKLNNFKPIDMAISKFNV